MSWELLDTISFFLFTLIFYFLGMLSKRLGEVMGMKKYYYMYYLGMALMLSGSVVMIPFFNIENPQLYGYALFSSGLTAGLIASIKYWGWLFKELFKG
jgi:cytochrome c biogenesis protein CcdA